MAVHHQPAGVDVAVAADGMELAVDGRFALDGDAVAALAVLAGPVGRGVVVQAGDVLQR